MAGVEHSERYEFPIAVWPNGTWCKAEEAHLHKDMPFDYKIIRPSILSEDEIPEIVRDSFYYDDEDGY